MMQPSFANPKTSPLYDKPIRRVHHRNFWITGLKNPRCPATAGTCPCITETKRQIPDSLASARSDAAWDDPTQPPACPGSVHGLLS